MNGQLFQIYWANWLEESFRSPLKRTFRYFPSPNGWKIRRGNNERIENFCLHLLQIQERSDLPLRRSNKSQRRAICTNGASNPEGKVSMALETNGRQVTEGLRSNEWYRVCQYGDSYGQYCYIGLPFGSRRITNFTRKKETVRINNACSRHKQPDL